MLGFEHRSKAELFLKALRERLEKFGLCLHPEKTRLIEFGRLAAKGRWERGYGRRESFDFLGFTPRWVREQGKEGVIVRRTTAKKRLRAKPKEVDATVRKQRHAPPSRQGVRLGRVVRGYFASHAVPGHIASLPAFREQAVVHWLRGLRRRVPKGRRNWERFRELMAFFIPRPEIGHPYPNERFDAKQPRSEPDAVILHVRICAGGGPKRAVPTATA